MPGIEELAPGAVVAGYRLESVLGEGGMGVVWGATEIASGEHVALKFLRSERADAKAAARFSREARAAMAIAHPNVARTRALLETPGGAPFLVMERLRGEPLRARLRRERRLDVAAAARIGEAIAAALEAAHALGVVHRDLKPENVFLAAGDEVKVLDFGVAKALAPDAEDLTATGAIVGTPAYMAPEQLFGAADVDGRADVWALGAVLYECLAGERPLPGDGLGPILKRIATGAIVPLAEARPDLPAAITGLVARMLSRRREDRPSLAEVRAALAPPRPRLPSAGGAAALAGAAVVAAAVAALAARPSRGGAGAVPTASTTASATVAAVPSATLPTASAGSMSSASSASSAGEPPAAVASRAPVRPSASPSPVSSPAESATPATREARMAAANALGRANEAAKRKDAAACLTALDEHDHVDPTPRTLSTNPSGDGPAVLRATCILLRGDCAAGKALYRGWAKAHDRDRSTDETLDENADTFVRENCRGKLEPRDELVRATDALGAAAGGQRKATAADCTAWYETAKRLLPSVAPRSNGDRIQYLSARLRSEAPRCFARAGDCATAARLHEADYRARHPAASDADLRRDFADLVRDTPCAVKSP